MVTEIELADSIIYLANELRAEIQAGKAESARDTLGLIEGDITKLLKLLPEDAGK